MNYSLVLLLADGDWPQFVRFWSLRDPAVRAALAGVLFLGVSSGLLGAFIVLRRLSLLGDSLGHAVLPGVCLGFLVAQAKDPRWIFGGALAAALVASWLITLIGRRSVLKPDACMGLVMSGFFGIGYMLLTRIQQLPFGSRQSGLNQVLFGQASAISERDLWFMGVATLVIVLGVGLAYKELTLTSFDEQFAATIGVPTRTVHYLLMTLVALSIVISIQAVGVVLLSAMLITPAAAAWLLTDRLPVMLLLSVLFATAGGVLGLNASFMGRNLPTGPFIVVTLSGIFAGAWCLAPQHGLLQRWLRRRRHRLRAQRENVLKSIYLAAEASQAAGGTPPVPIAVSLARLAGYRDESPPKLHAALRPLVRRGLIDVAAEQVVLTPLGAERAIEIIRNFRLWERFLTEEASLPVDHTQAGAEQLEHILSPDLARELEARLSDGKS